MESEKSSSNAKPPSNEQPTMTSELAGIALSLRVPPFWQDRPRLWFYTFEAAVTDLKKSSNQLAQMVITQLAKGNVEQISDLLYDPPSSSLYEAIKERLISVYEESAGKQLQKLTTEMELGDQKPSQLLRRMRELARAKVPDSTLRLMWLNHLPPHVRSILIVSDTISNTTALDELAKIADKMMEQQHEVSGVSTRTPPPPANNQPAGTDMESMMKAIENLSLEVAALRASQGSPHIRERTQQYHRQRTSSRPRTSAEPSPLCFYHRRFGSRAQRCTTPCSFYTEQQKN